MQNATQAKARSLSKGVQVTVSTYDHHEYKARLMDAGLRTMWLIDANCLDVILKYENVASIEVMS
jgi:hypothetical protein